MERSKLAIELAATINHFSCARLHPSSVKSSVAGPSRGTVVAHDFSSVNLQAGKETVVTTSATPSEYFNAVLQASEEMNDVRIIPAVELAHAFRPA